MTASLRLRKAILAVGSAVFSTLWAAAAPAPCALGAARTLGDFETRDEPKAADWRAFIQASESEQAQLWAYQQARGRQLHDWAWGWRLGWVRVCGRSTQPYCREVLRQGLFDKALVVRAETASRLGQRYEGTGDGPVTELLIKAYRNGRNLRRGKPLYVQRRILYALHQVGGAAGLAAGRRLAADNPVTQSYWDKLESPR